jgi:hypothetical protein
VPGPRDDEKKHSGFEMLLRASATNPLPPKAMSAAPLLLALALLAPATVIAQASRSAAPAAAGEEVEVTFEEEVDRDSASGLAPLPRYRTSRWLVGLPALAVLLLAWNVRWRRPPKPVFVPRPIVPPGTPVERGRAGPDARTPEAPP